MLKDDFVIPPWCERTAQLVGSEGLERLFVSKVLVVGVGGVGAYAVEMLARAGVGRLTLVDGDVVNASNINRQLPALHSTLSMPKVEVMKQRVLDINPQIKVEIVSRFLEEQDIASLFVDREYDFVVDAIDTIAPKVSLILHADKYGIPIVSSMGAGAKSDPGSIRLADISKTYNCALAKVMRLRLKQGGFKGKLPVVFSEELPNREAIIRVEGEKNKKSTAGTLSYMPAIFGCTLAGYVIRQLIEKQ